MPKPVHKPKGTDTESFLEWSRQEAPEVTAAFESQYEDAAIIGGECKRCGAHVVEQNQLHKDWHRGLNFVVWFLGSVLRAEASP
jgi:hypothetical protein